MKFQALPVPYETREMYDLKSRLPVKTTLKTSLLPLDPARNGQFNPKWGKSMSAPGPVPQEVKRRRNKPAIAPTVAPPIAYSGQTPALPNAEKYSARTVAWYETYRTCEQAGTFTRTAWQMLWDLADLMDAYYEKPTAMLWAQISKTLSGFMALPSDQRRSNWKVEAPKVDRENLPANVSDIADRRTRLVADVS